MLSLTLRRPRPLRCVLVLGVLAEALGVEVMVAPLEVRGLRVVVVLFEVRPFALFWRGELARLKGGTAAVCEEIHCVSTHASYSAVEDLHILITSFTSFIRLERMMFCCNHLTSTVNKTKGTNKNLIICFI